MTFGDVRGVAARMSPTWVCRMSCILIGFPTDASTAGFLPRRLRITEVDLDTGIDRELCVLGHLFALIPRQ